MAESVLSQAELSALLDEDEATSSGRTVSDYDLTKTTRITGELLKQMGRIHQAFAIQIGLHMGKLLRVDLDVEPGSITEQSYASFRSSVPEALVGQFVTLKPSEEVGVLISDASLFGSLLDRLLGGAGVSPAEPKTVTDLDRDVVNPAMLVMVNGFASAWTGVLDMTAELGGHFNSPEDLESMPSAETVLTMDVRIAGPVGFSGGVVSMTVPLIAIEPALVKLGKPPRFSAPRKVQTKDQRQRLEKNIGGAELPLVVTLGTTTLSLSEILALSVGDVLVLDQSPGDPVVGRFRDKVRVLGKPGRVNRRLAVVVQQMILDGAGGTPAAPSRPQPTAGKEVPHGR